MRLSRFTSLKITKVLSRLTGCFLIFFSFINWDVSAQIPMAPMTFETYNLYRYLDLNFNGVLEVQEVENAGGYNDVNYLQLKGQLDYYDETTLFTLLKEDLTSLSMPNFFYKILDSVPYSDFNRINDFGYWDEIHILLGAHDTVVSVDGINDGYDRIKKVIFHTNNIDEIQKLTIKRVDEFSIEGSITVIDSVQINELNEITLRDFENSYLDIQNFSGGITFKNHTGQSYLDLSHLTLSSLSLQGTNDIDFICLSNSFDPNSFYDFSTNDVFWATDCSLNQSTNQINNQNTALAIALINANPTVDVNGDNIIQGWELAQADTIIISNANIDSLNGIHLAENLVYLDVSNNNLDTIALANFPNLQYLNISGNNLSTIDFSGVLVNAPSTEELQTLSAGDGLDSLIVSYNNLTALDVSELSISYLAADNNPSLQTICVSQPQLDNQVQYWTKDASTIFSAGCSVITSAGNVTLEQNKLYPNPATEIIQFSAGLNTISNIEGRAVFVNAGNATQVNVSNWASGIYIAQFNNGEIIKVVVK